jgi:hypothetical protein
LDIQRFHAGIDSPQFDEPLGIAEIPVEDRQIAPGGVASDVADVRINAGRYALASELFGR